MFVRTTGNAMFRRTGRGWRWSWHWPGRDALTHSAGGTLTMIYPLQGTLDFLTKSGWNPQEIAFASGGIADKPGVEKAFSGPPSGGSSAYCELQIFQLPAIPRINES